MAARWESTRALEANAAALRVWVSELVAALAGAVAKGEGEVKALGEEVRVGTEAREALEIAGKASKEFRGGPGFPEKGERWGPCPGCDGYPEGGEGGTGKG